MDYTPSQYQTAVHLLGLKGKRGWGRQESEFFQCPLGHIDKTPSLRINFTTGQWYCHSCKQGGHLVSLSYRLQNRHLNELLGLAPDMEIISPYTKPEPVARGQLPVADIRGVLVPWGSSPEARAYLDYRGILPRIAVASNIKYLDDGYVNGVPWHHRLMIPVYDETERTVNWEGRDVTFEQKAKCLYPKGAMKPLYEWWKLDKTKPLYLFEGLIKMLVARSDPYFANSTTMFGSGINDLQLEQLREFQYIIVVRDMDTAGSTVTLYLEENWKTTSNQLGELGLHARYGIKDVDEIPTKLDMTVRDFRLAGGFVDPQVLKNDAAH